MVIPYIIFYSCTVAVVKCVISFERLHCYIESQLLKKLYKVDVNEYNGAIYHE